MVFLEYINQYIEFENTLVDNTEKMRISPHNADLKNKKRNNQNIWLF